MNEFMSYFLCDGCFSILAETVDRNNRKYQARYKKMEHQMLTMVERHTAQVSIKFPLFKQL